MRNVFKSIDDCLAVIGSPGDFQDTLAEVWQSQTQKRSSLALLMVEIDFFDPYQFACGLAASEHCLEAVAEVLLETTRRAGARVFVDGAARFAVLVPGADDRAAERLAAEIHFQVGGLVITHPRSPVSRSVSVSVGLATQLPDAQSSPRELVEAAKAALAGARAGGRDRVIRRDRLAAV